MIAPVCSLDRFKIARRFMRLGFEFTSADCILSCKPGGPMPISGDSRR